MSCLQELAHRLCLRKSDCACLCEQEITLGDVFCMHRSGWTQARVRGLQGPAVSVHAQTCLTKRLGSFLHLLVCSDGSSCSTEQYHICKPIEVCCAWQCRAVTSQGVLAAIAASLNSGISPSIPHIAGTGGPLLILKCMSALHPAPGSLQLLLSNQKEDTRHPTCCDHSRLLISQG